MKLGEVCDSISVTFDKTKQQVVLVNTSDVFNGKVTNHALVDNKGLKGQFKKTFQKGDILYSEIRPKNKRFAFIDFNANDYVASTKLMVIRANKKVLPQYLYQVIKSEEVINQLQSLAESRSGTFPQITFSELAQIDARIPELAEQKEIADFLKLFDDKIELNNKINHHLEEVINAIFLRYIESSKQLEAKKLGELFDTKTATFNPAKAREEKVNHFSLPAFDSSQYPLVDETNNIKSNKNIIKEYSVLFSKLNPSTKRVWVPFTNQDLISVCSTEFVSLAGKDKIEQAILFAIINSQIFQDYFVAHATGTTNSRQRTKPSVAYEFEIPYNKNLLNQLGRTLSLLLTQLEDNLHQIHKLTQIRNELLPKLLSGKLSINQATK